GDFHFDVGQASDRAAIDAYEVRMVAAGMLFVAELEAPGVIAGIEPGQKAGISQLHETAVNRRFVKALRDEHVRDIGVAYRLAGSRDVLQDGYPCAGAAQLGAANG